MQILAHTFLLLATSLLFLGALAEDVPSSPAKRHSKHRHHGQRGHHRHHHHHHHLDLQEKAPPAGKIPQKEDHAPTGVVPPAPATGAAPSPPVGVPFGDKPANSCEPTGGMATQYWDCCKVAGAWPGNPNVTRPVYSCAKDGETQLESSNVLSGCQGGTAFACNKHQPFVSATNPMLAYVVGARPHQLGIYNFYGACYSITFKELPGKTLVFQAVNTGEYPKTNQIDIQVPGGGVGIENTCPMQWGSPPDGWGRRFGGIFNRNECSKLPQPLQRGCHWRYDWLAPADHPDGINPTIASMCRVKCPKILTDLTGSTRLDEANYPDAPQ
ncbi:unnamed protein product [Tilletia controversa]|uniref:cellulase n=1 Tax=Tilletia controversa TaxID=13291 RepID=A0A8X7SVH8_9BASI|nr:hypothetical protein CF328_g4406 [Tilletia controversa]KAE8245623.1 hypothetical protein A4X06_0g5536 [Tilletia controversa]CAD6922919.1 unnamed protein product [Tilletia controversa]CAD6939470.1 unnamed protein product [Tilletia controversa]CAD6943578.1 unnamed protein product [Tilletia controversa]